MGKTVFLIGFMGSGKSTVGPILARRLGRPFVDLDQEIEKHAGAAVSEIFQLWGEDFFRSVESSQLSRQAGQPEAVVALGGGAFASAENRESVRQAGVSVWLDLDADTAWERCAQDPARPLAQDRARFEALHRQRKAVYQQADWRVGAAGKTPQEIAEEILELLQSSPDQS